MQCPGVLVRLLGVARDITEHKHAEERLHKQVETERRVLAQISAGVPLADVLDDLVRGGGAGVRCRDDGRRSSFSTNRESIFCTAPRRACRRPTATPFMVLRSAPLLDPAVRPPSVARP